MVTLNKFLCVVCLFLLHGCSSPIVDVAPFADLPEAEGGAQNVAIEAVELLPENSPAPFVSTEVKNPFLTAQERATYEDGRLLPAPGMSVSAIFFKDSAQSQAIINGRIMKKGEFLQNMELVRIEPERVIMKDSQTEYVVTIGELR